MLYLATQVSIHNCTKPRAVCSNETKQYHTILSTVYSGSLEVPVVGLLLLLPANPRDRVSSGLFL